MSPSHTIVTPRSKCFSPSSAGFSVVELLTVVTLLGVLAGIGSISLKGNAGASRLATASTQSANLFESARETAILRKSPVAIALFPADSNSPAALTAFEYQPSSQTWSRISRWEKLPTGVIFDPSASTDINSALVENSPQVSPALPTTDYAGSARSAGVSGGYAYLVFLPNGSLLQQHSKLSLVRFVEGIGDSATFRHTGSAENFVDLVINPTTGRIKIVRPN